MQSTKNDYSLAVLPFLKTQIAVSIGRCEFRSTDDTNGLSPDQARCVREIADMLYLQDNLRIKSSSYAIVPLVDLSQSAPESKLEHLANVHAFVTYLYAAPRHSFGDLFLSSEHASMAIFTPGRVSVYLVRPHFHVEPVGPQADLEPDNRGEVEGYAGLYNFRHHFWVTRGSRLYGPKPSLTLNHSQDLSSEVMHAVETRVDYKLLLHLLCVPYNQASSRFFTAVRWFNAANNEANDNSSAIVNLAIAFETLLNLPAEEKKDRLTDAISLLLGRVPRLDIWGRQFYDARSQIVHEGRSQQFRFMVADSVKVKNGPLYQSLLSYGRQLFQFCLGTLLVGYDLAEKADVKQILATNQERFLEICKILADETTGRLERLESMVPIIEALEKYKYVPESDLKIETMIGSIRLAAKLLLEDDDVIEEELKLHLRQFIAAQKTNIHLQELGELQALQTFLKNSPIQTEITESKALRDLVEVVWSYVFMHYFWLKKKHSTNDEPQAKG